MENRNTIEDFAPGTLHSTGSVADFLGVTTATIRNYIRRGKLVSKKLFGGSRYVITAESVREVFGEILLSRDAKTTQPSVDATVAAKRALGDLKKLKR